MNSVIPSTQPRLVLVAPASLSYGFSRAAFVDYASQSGNMILLTSKGEPGVRALTLV